MFFSRDCRFALPQKQRLKICSTYSKLTRPKKCDISINIRQRRVIPRAFSLFGISLVATATKLPLGLARRIGVDPNSLARLCGERYEKFRSAFKCCGSRAEPLSLIAEPNSAARFMEAIRKGSLKPFQRLRSKGETLSRRRRREVMMKALCGARGACKRTPPRKLSPGVDYNRKSRWRFFVRKLVGYFEKHPMTFSECALWIFTSETFFLKKGFQTFQKSALSKDFRSLRRATKLAAWIARAHRRRPESASRDFM